MTTPTTDLYADVYPDVYGGTGTGGGGTGGLPPAAGDTSVVTAGPNAAAVVSPTWRSKPQPHSAAVVNLYLDSRDSSGSPQLIDRFYIDPVTSGVSLNLYYSPAPPPAGTVFEALDDPLLPSLLVAAGTALPSPTAQGIVFPGDPGWLTLSNQGTGTVADSPWWTGVEIMPGFGSTDAGAYVVADSGLLQLSYLGGEWVVSLPLAGGAVLASWAFDFDPGQRLQFVAGFDGTSFFAWSPLGGFFHVPAALPVPPAPAFRFGGALPGTYGMQVAAMSPAAWWRLGDGSGSFVAADSAGGFTGTPTGVIFGSETAPGGQSSAAFDGSTSKIATTYSPAGLAAITLETWCSFEGLGQGASSCILANSSPASDHGGFALADVSGTPLVIFGTGPGSVAVQPASPAGLDPAAWHHIVATWDGAVITLYADGQEVASGAFAGSLQPGTHPVTIGCDPAGSSFFAGNIADAAVYPYAFTAAQVQANYAASSRASGSYILTAFVLKQEQAVFTTGLDGSPVPQSFQDFAADAAKYVFPVLAASQGSTLNAVARFSPQFLLGATCPWGFVGGLGSAYESCAWVPVQRDYKMARGYAEFDPVLAAAWKFEFTNLRPEPFDYLQPASVPANFLPDALLPSPAQLAPTAPAALEPGMTVNQSVGPAITYSDTPAPSPDPEPGVPLPTEGLYAAQPEGVGQMASQGGSLYNLHSWQPPAVSGGWPNIQPHYYRQAEVGQPSRVAYFAALSTVRMYRLDPTAADDTEMYLDTFANAANVDPATLAPGGWSWAPGLGLTVPSNLAGAAQAESVILNSAHAVTGVQFATVQSGPVQLLADPDFSDPAFAGWGPVGDALPLETSQVNSQLGNMAAVSRAGGSPALGSSFHTMTWDYLEAAYPTWGDLMAAIPSWAGFGLPPVTSAMGGLAYTGQPVRTTTAGRLYAAARVFANQALTAPLYLQLLDGATGAVIAEAGQPVAGGAVTEWFAGFTLGEQEVSSSTWAELEALYPTWGAIASTPLAWSQMDTSVTPLGATVSVRLVQKDSTSDTWDVDNISVFEDALVWEFSNDGGLTWYPAYDIRNNPRGVVTFPPAAPGEGTQLKWRAAAFRPGVSVAALALRPWYSAWPHGIVPRASGVGHGPNVSPLDHFAAVERDPRWQLSSTPLPDDWYFSIRQALNISVPASDFPGPALPVPDAGLGSALVYEPPELVIAGEPTWSDIYSDVYTDVYAIPDGGDVYTDVFCDTYGVDDPATTGTVRSGAAAFAAAVSLSATAADIPPLASALGADFGPVAAADASIAAWASATSEPVAARRVAFGNQIPASLAASLVAGDAGVRRVLLDFRPDATTTPGQLSAFLASCQAGGLQASVSLWAGPDRTFGDPRDYLALVAQYAAAIRLNGYAHVFTIGNDSAAAGLIPVWYPGDDLVDVIAPTFWCTGPAPGSGGGTLAVASGFAGAHGKPFGLAGFGVDRSRFSPAQGEAFLSYTARLFSARKAAGSINADLIYLATGSYSLIGAPPALLASYQEIAAVL